MSHAYGKNRHLDRADLFGVGEELVAFLDVLFSLP